MSRPSFMTRAERVERLVGDAMASRHADAEPVVDVVQRVAAGLSSCEINIPGLPTEDLMDNVKDDVSLGIEIACQLKVGQTVYSATVSDSDERALHFFFIAASEDELFERVRKALEAK